MELPLEPDPLQSCGVYIFISCQSPGSVLNRSSYLRRIHGDNGSCQKCRVSCLSLYTVKVQAKGKECKYLSLAALYPSVLRFTSPL